MGTSYNPRIVKNGLVLCLDAANKKSYPGTGSTWTDLSKNKFTGSMSNCTFNSSNQGSIAFNGTNSTVYYSSNSSYSFGTGDFAVEFWVNFNSVAGSIVPICQNDPVGTSSNNKWWVGLTSNQLILAQHSTSNGAYCAWSPSTGVWYNGLVQRISGTVSIYINGISQTVTDPTIFSATSFSQNGITLGGISTSYYLNGNISNYKLYNKGLLANEAIQNYIAIKGRFGL